jgi:hypothetical protein
MIPSVLAWAAAALKRVAAAIAARTDTPFFRPEAANQLEPIAYLLPVRVSFPKATAAEYPILIS